MGLDQYLYGIKTVDYQEDKSNMEKIGYWRKANWLHKWVEERIGEILQNCAYYELGESELKDLVLVIDEVLKNNKIANERLPTKSGFFFGSTEYNEWYFDSLKETKNHLEDILENTNYEYYLYYAWW